MSLCKDRKNTANCLQTRLGGQRWSSAMFVRCLPEIWRRDLFQLARLGQHHWPASAEFYSVEHHQVKADAIMLLTYQRLVQRCITAALKRKYIGAVGTGPLQKTDNGHTEWEWWLKNIQSPCSCRQSYRNVGESACACCTRFLLGVTCGAIHVVHIRGDCSDEDFFWGKETS